MKLITIFFSLLITSFTRCYEPLIDNYPIQHQAPHYLPYPDNTSHTHNVPPSFRHKSYVQRKQYYNDLSQAQKLTFIKNCMCYFSPEYAKPVDIPYVFPVSMSIITDPTPSIAPPSITEPSLPTPLYQESDITALEDELFIQKQCPEWDNHTDILDTRGKVLHGLGKLFKHAERYATTFAKNNLTIKKSNALTTAEGIIVRIANNVTEYIKNEQLANNIKANNNRAKTINLSKNKLGRAYINIENQVLNNIRSGSALKHDALHALNDIIDNYATYAKECKITGGDACIYKLYQIEGSLNEKSGIFEWLIHPDPLRGVTHRRFIEGVPITGKPNAIKKRLI